jgi:putative ABC transport system permease protein
MRFALRGLRKTPAFTIGAVTTIALAVGATTAIFTVVYGVLIRQLPYREVERVFWVWSDQSGRGRAPFNVPDFLDYRDSQRTLDGFAGFFATSANLSDQAAAERVQGIRATGNFFNVIGARARLGRLLLPRDEAPGSDHVAVLTEPFWRRRFGADSNIVGSSIVLDGDRYTVVGVLSAGFAVPVRDVEVILPYLPDHDPRRGARNSFNFITGAARVAANASDTEALRDLTGIARRLQKEFPVENATKRGVQLVPVLDGVVGPFRTALISLFGAVSGVLLISCANLANLMLTRGASRRKDVAVQMSLGAPRAVIVQHVVIEAVVLSAAGAAIGALLARLGVAGLIALAPADLPRVGDIRVDATVLTFTLAASLTTAVLFGAAPAFAAATVDLRDALQVASRGATASGRRLRDTLVAAEVALAAALLVVMSLLVKSYANAAATVPGFEAEHVLTARLTLPAARFMTRESITGFQRALSDRVRSFPTVTHDAAVSMLPLSGLQSRVPFTVVGKPVERDRVPVAQFRTVTPGYFEALGIPVKRGRPFSSADTDQTRPVAVINEALAARWLEGADPIGARLLVDDNDGAPRPIDIVGVVGNVRQLSLDAGDTWDLYLPYAQVHVDNIATVAANMFWVVRTTGEAGALGNSFRREIRRLDAGVAAAQIRPMTSYLSASLAPRRFNVALMTAFAVAALAVAITGIYAVTSYSVAQRSREINIRVALGATRASILRLIVGQGSKSILAGLAAGIALAAGTVRSLSALLFGLSPADPATYAQTGVIVAVVSLAAAWLPAGAAARRAGGRMNVE